MPPQDESEIRCLLPADLEDKVGWFVASGDACNDPLAQPLGEVPTATPAPGGDTADSLGAPSPPVDPVAPQPAPTEPDPRALTEQYLDPSNPLPDYDVADALEAAGTALEDLAAAVENVIRNRPPPKQPHPSFGRPDRQGGVEVAEPVLVASGQFEARFTDVVLPSAGGMDLRLERVYRSGEPWFGPWGWNWDYNYNVYGRELADGGLAVWTGDLNENVFPLRPDGSYGAPRGVRQRLERFDGVGPTDRQYRLRDISGITRVLARPPGFPLTDRFPLIRVEDRFGNGHDLLYDAEGRLDRVADKDGRFLRFEYGDCGLLEVLEDHTGRMWRYTHDVDVEHLVAVTTPPTPDSPDGMTTRFEYDRFREHPALLHNLIRVIDSVGRCTVENEYGSDPGSLDFGRVVRQVYGDWEALYAATLLQDVPQVAELVDAPARRVEVIDPGVLHVYTFNAFGDLLDHRFRLVRDGSMRVLAHAWRYDAQGNVVSRWEPDGLGVVMTYDSDNEDPRATGNVLTISLLAPPTVIAPSRTVMRCTYEPRDHQLATMTNEAGRVTRLTYDIDIDPRGVGALMTVEHPVATLPDGAAQTAIEHFTYSPEGFVTEHTSAAGRSTRLSYGSTGPAAGLLVERVSGVGAEVERERYTYDAWGNVVTVTDGSGAQFEHEFDALGRVLRTRRPSIDGSTGDITYRYGPDGQIAAVETPAGGCKDLLPGETTISQTFVFDVVGQLVETTYAANTTMPRRWSFVRDGEGFPLRVTDPAGRVLSVRYDERHLVLDERIELGGEVRSVRQRFDRGGRVVESTDAAARKVNLSYDGWGRLRSIDSPGNADARTRTTYEYTDDDAPIRITTTGDNGFGATVDLLDVRQSWDERGRLVRREIGARATVLLHDSDELVVETINERGASTRYNYDSVGRLRETIDAVGDRVTCEYDVRGLPVALVAADTAGTHRVEEFWDDRRRLARKLDDAGTSTFVYDDRDLLIGSVDPSGSSCSLQYDAVGDLIGATLGADDPIAHQWTRDSGGRVISYIDPSGAVTRWDWTIDDRWSRRIRPSGRVDVRHFDEVGEVNAETAPSGCSVSFDRGADGLIARARWSAAPGFDSLDDLIIHRDGAGRPVRMTQGATVLGLGWDEHGRLVDEDGPGGRTRLQHDDAAGHVDFQYPDGRVDRHLLDPLGRVNEIRREVTGAAALTTYPPGAVLARYGYARGEQLNRRELANGTATSLHHDTVLRATDVRHVAADGTVLADVRYLHDAAGRRRARLTDDVSHGNRVYDHDVTGQVSMERRGIAGVATGPAPSPAEQLTRIAELVGQPGEETSWKANAAGAIDETRTSAAASLVVERWTLDADHAPSSVERTTPAGSAIAPVVHDADGHRTRDPRFDYRYDAAGRLVRVSAGGSVVFRHAYDPLGRVVEFTSGPTVRRTAYFGGLAVAESDGAGVPLRQTAFGPSGDPIVLVSDGADHFGHVDAHACLVCVTDAAGAVQTRYDYGAFGATRVLEPDGTTPHLSHDVPPTWAGHTMIPGAGLYDMRGRIYDPATARFLQRDPRGAINSADPYAVAGGDPVDLLDPNGEIIIIPAVIAGAVIVGALAGAGYSAYDAVQHPQDYEGAGFLKPLGYTVGGAAIGWLSAIWGIAAGGAVTLGLGGASTGGSAAGGFGLLSWQGFAIVSAEAGVSWTFWRAGFHGLFPELEDPPSLRTLATDMATGGLLRLAGPAIKAIVPGTVWNSAEVAVRETGEGMRHALQGRWQRFGSEVPLVLRAPTWEKRMLAVKRWFWEVRKFASKRAPYWKLQGGAAGKDLSHIFIAHSAARQPLPQWAEPFRNAGFNLLELPKDLNRWLGHYMYREEAFRHALLGTLTTVGLAAAALTRTIQNWGTQGPGVHGWEGQGDQNSLAAPSAPAVTVHSPKGSKR